MPLATGAWSQEGDFQSVLCCLSLGAPPPAASCFMGPLYSARGCCQVLTLLCKCILWTAVGSGLCDFTSSCAKSVIVSQ